MWLSNSNCAKTVVASWQLGLNQMGDDAILKKVEKCGKELTWWS